MICHFLPTYLLAENRHVMYVVRAPDAIEDVSDSQR